MSKQIYLTTDKTIRQKLLADLNIEYRDCKNTAIIPEFSLPNGSARIDVAVVNGVMHGYEFKSDFDNLKRLQRQINAYNLIFDKVTIIIGKRHILNALPLIPDWWGITVAKLAGDNKPLLLEVRTAKKNPDQDIYSILQLLWKNEAAQLLGKDPSSTEIRKMKKDLICHNLMTTFKKKELKDNVRLQLVRRFIHSDWRSA